MKKVGGKGSTGLCIRQTCPLGMALNELALGELDIRQTLISQLALGERT